MKTKNKALVWAAAAVWALALTGCGERVKETEAPQTEVKTEAVTEAVVVRVTEKPTEKPTEPPTEKPTEPPTEKPTEAPKRDLTPEEELAEEIGFDNYATMFANDSVNYRLAPDTSDSENVIDSFEKFDEVTVIGETPNWYKILRGDREAYVSKKYLSATYEEAASAVEADADVNTPAETMEEYAPEAAEQSAAPAPAAGVEGFADSFPVLIAQDANLRANGAENADVIDVINKGTNVTAIGESGDWYQVSYNGKTGFVSKSVTG